MAETMRPTLRNICYWILVVPLAVIALPIIWTLGRFERRRWPRSVEEAVTRLFDDLTAEDLQSIRTENPDVDWYSFGQGIRNSFGLWAGNNALLESCGVQDARVPADAASLVIINALKQRLQELASRGDTAKASE